MTGDWAYVDGWNNRAFIPDHKITQDLAEYVYRPCRGYAASLAVEDTDGRIKGTQMSRNG